MQDFIKSLVKRYEYLKGRRDNWDTHYQELADYMLPRKADIVRKRSRGEKRMELIFDGTALQAVDLLAASLHGMLTSGATPWFILRIFVVRFRSLEQNNYTFINASTTACSVGSLKQRFLTPFSSK